MSTRTPRVSVVIPVRDHPAWLAESLASVFAQPYDDLEVIVIDDGSTEDLGPAVAPWGTRVRFVRQAPAGVAAATNHGARLACGAILAFHDADDLMEPARITAPLARLDAEPEVALVFGNGVRMRADGAPLTETVIPPAQARRLARHGLTLPELLRRSVVYLQASLVRRATFEALGGLPSFPAGADWAFALRCLLHHRVAYVDAPLFRYRQHEASLTADRVRMAAMAVAVLRDVAAAEPALVTAVGRRGFDRALARRLARLAAQEARAGAVDDARAHLREAAALAPFAFEYRLRLWRLGSGT